MKIMGAGFWLGVVLGAGIALGLGMVSRVEATNCRGNVNCLTKFQIEGGYYCEYPETFGGGSCSAVSESDCNDKDSELVGSCKFDECAMGGCYWDGEGGGCGGD